MVERVEQLCGPLPVQAGIVVEVVPRQRPLQGNERLDVLSSMVIYGIVAYLGLLLMIALGYATYMLTGHPNSGLLALGATVPAFAMTGLALGGLHLLGQGRGRRSSRRPDRRSGGELRTGALGWLAKLCNRDFAIQYAAAVFVLVALRLHGA